MEVRNFITQFDDIDDVFIRRGLGLDMESDIINSTDTDYVMRRIRERYLHGSSVTIVMVGRCTWARRYVDWEIQASLRRGTGILPNGLIGIILPSGVGATGPLASGSIVGGIAATIPSAMPVCMITPRQPGIFQG